MTANAVAVLVGKKGSGKTSRLRELVAPARRLLVADPEGSWELRPGDEVIEGAAALLSRVKSAGVQDPAVPFQWIYRDRPEPMQVAAPGVAYVLQACTLVVDELFWLCNARHLPPYLLLLLQIGRRRRVNLLGTTREPQEIHDFWFSTADVLYFFHVDPGNGLDRIRRRYRALGDELPTLPKFVARTYGDETALRLIGREGRSLPRGRKEKPARR